MGEEGGGVGGERRREVTRTIQLIVEGISVAILCRGQRAKGKMRCTFVIRYLP